MKSRILLLCTVLVALVTASLAQSQPESFPINTASAGAGNCATYRAQNNSTVGIIVSGTWSGTLTPTLNIFPSRQVNKKVTPVDSSTAQSTITANGGYIANIGGFTQFQICATAWTSGTAVVDIFATPAPNNSTFASSGGGFTAAGDLSGTNTSQEVAGILSNALPSLSAGFLYWSGSAWNFSSGIVSATSPLTLSSNAVQFITTPLTGQLPFAVNGSQPSFGSPGIVGRSVSGSSDTILCDSATAIRDRGGNVTYTDSTASTVVAVTLPAPSTSGCGSNFYFGLNVFNSAAPSTPTDVVTVTPGSGTIDGLANETFLWGDSVTISSPDNTNFIARGKKTTHIVCTPQFSTSDTLSGATTTNEQFFATTCKIPAGMLIAGRVIRLMVGGEMTTSSSPTSPQMRVTLCQVSGCATGTTVRIYSGVGVAPSASITSIGNGATFSIQGTAAAGTSANVETSCVSCTAVRTGVNNAPWYGNGLSTQEAVNTSVDEYITVSIAYSGTTAGNSYLLTQMVVEAIN